MESGAAEAAGAAGEGVTGTAGAAGAAAGAGAAGVAAGAALDGVDGPCEEALADAWEAFGYSCQQDSPGRSIALTTYLGYHTHYEALFLNAIRFDGVCILKDFS